MRIAQAALPTRLVIPPSQTPMLLRAAIADGAIRYVSEDVHALDAACRPLRERRLRRA